MRRGGRFLVDKPGDKPVLVDPKSEENHIYHRAEHVAADQKAAQAAAVTPIVQPAAPAVPNPVATGASQADSGESDPAELMPNDDQKGSN